MYFKRLSEYFQKLENTSLRNTMVEILSDLFKKANADEIGQLCYLLQGRVAPLYEAIEFGMADKMMIRAIAQGLELSVNQVTDVFKKEGDLGLTVEKLKTQSANWRTKQTNKSKNLIISQIFDFFYQLATSQGEGSQEQKINILANLIKQADPLSARFIVRIPLGKLRLGFSDMTILDSLSWMLAGTKEFRSRIEKAYNVRPDLGFISRTIKEKGIAGLNHVVPQVGTPILMARAERMTNGADIIEKIGKCAIEPKYDGFRLQIHFSKIKIQNSKVKNDHENLNLLDDELEHVRMFSRNLENVTRMYPDIAAGIVKQVKADEAILEGEAIAYNPKTHEYLPFQETVQRKRKYDIDQKAKEVPLRLFAFELLYEDGVSLLEVPYKKRREKLADLIKKGDRIEIAEEQEVDDPQILESIFQDSISKGLEGVMAKKLDGIYRAGSRDFTWIKYKRSYQGKLSDTIDAVVMGYDLGQGKRADFGIGDFLIGVYDENSESFTTMAKIGTGLTDQEWREIHLNSQKLRVSKKPDNFSVDRMMECDVWIEPKIVVEIRADEITRSPVHTTGRVMEATKSGSSQQVKEAGYALRFPRLERFRIDKKPTDATTVSEIIKMYKLQEK